MNGVKNLGRFVASLASIASAVTVWVLVTVPLESGSLSSLELTLAMAAGAAGMGGLICWVSYAVLKHDANQYWHGWTADVRGKAERLLKRLTRGLFVSSGVSTVLTILLWLLLT